MAISQSTLCILSCYRAVLPVTDVDQVRMSDATHALGKISVGAVEIEKSKAMNT